MACPYFIPQVAHPNTDDRAWMLPLGDEWGGACAAGDAANPPARLCNLGYARGQCPYFPAGEAADAVRFSIAAIEGAIIRIHYAVEGAHLPIGQGEIRCRATDGTPVDDGGSPLHRQAAAYAASWLRRSR